MAGPTKNLPFEYAQRWDELTKPSGIPADVTRLLNERDRNLEDYLANLSTGSGSVPIYCAQFTGSVAVDENKSIDLDFTVAQESTVNIQLTWQWEQYWWPFFYWKWNGTTPISPVPLMGPDTSWSAPNTCAITTAKTAGAGDHTVSIGVQNVHASAFAADAQLCIVVIVGTYTGDDCVQFPG